MSDLDLNMFQSTWDWSTGGIMEHRLGFASFHKVEVWDLFSNTELDFCQMSWRTKYLGLKNLKDISFIWVLSYIFKLSLISKWRQEVGLLGSGDDNSVSGTGCSLMLLLTLRMSTSTRHQHQSDSLGPRLTPGQRARPFLWQLTFKPSQTGTIQIKNGASVGENVDLDIQIPEAGLSRPHTGKAHW